MRVSQEDSCAQLHSVSPVFPAQSPHMKIGIVGSGKMGAGLGRLWAHEGHQVMFSYSRRPEKLEDLVQEIGSHAQSGTPREAVRFADVVLLAVPWAAIGDAVVAAGPLEGKIVLTCVNPLGPLGLEVGLMSSAAEEIAKLAPGAIVIEAFNTIFAGILHSRPHLSANNTPTVFYCGDDRDAKAKTAELIGDAGLHPVDAGPLQNARYIEPLAMLMMELGYSQRLGTDIAMRLMNPAGAAELARSAGALARSLVGIFAGTNSTSADQEVLAEDFVAYLPYYRLPVRGRDKFEAQMKDFRSAFTHFQCDIDEVIDDGIRVAVRWTWRGTHSGELLGIAPTHRRIEFSETHLLRISGGRIAEDHVSANLLDLLHQLGRAQFAAA
jgi:predicted dinucleotide-binding enzyme/predicted ester cyclase